MIGEISGSNKHEWAPVFNCDMLNYPAKEDGLLNRICKIIVIETIIETIISLPKFTDLAHSIPNSNCVFPAILYRELNVSNCSSTATAF